MKHRGFRYLLKQPVQSNRREVQWWRYCKCENPNIQGKFVDSFSPRCKELEREVGEIAELLLYSDFRKKVEYNSIGTLMAV